MAHSSIPIFLDPPNWHQSNIQPQANDHNPEPSHLPAFVPPPPPTALHGGGIRPGSMAYRARLAMIPLPEAALKCPRCDSTNTKFCYFNNYSLSQPRHFCKACRRYWTRGGALRSVPVGGGFRKNKKKKKSNPSKSPIDAQTEMGNSRSMDGAIISTSNNIESTTNSISNFPSQPLHLPSIPSLQHHLSRFGAPSNNSALNYAGIHIGNMNSDRELDQWQQQSPFTTAGLEPPATAAYPQTLQTEVHNFGLNPTSSIQFNCHQQLQNSTLFSRIPMKNEEQERRILSNFLRPADQNSQLWGSDHQSSWMDLSALSSSSSSHLL